MKSRRNFMFVWRILNAQLDLTKEVRMRFLHQPPSKNSISFLLLFFGSTTKAWHDFQILHGKFYDIAHTGAS